MTGESVDRANCLQLGFKPEHVENVTVTENGGVTILLNEAGQEHLDQVNDMRGFTHD